MTGKLSADCIILAFFTFFSSLHSVAQPTLPDLTGTYENGTVTLSWNCPYNAIKAISVFRSADSMNNYELIGYVKKTNKGIQTYDDMHPPAMKIYYKLAITFNSGLTWRSNHYGIQIPLRPDVPEKQEYNADKPGSTIQKESDAVMPKGNALPDTSRMPATQKPQSSVSMTTDTSRQIASSAEKTTPTRPRIILKHDDQPDIESPVIIKSKYIFADPTTGNIELSLPDDLAGHHYSLKFYNPQNHLLFDIVRVNDPKIIFDKRNFQHRGIYKYVLRKDYTELEAGYLIINP